MAGKKDEGKLKCSFCGKTQNQVHKLIKYVPGVYICDQCIELCSEIIEEEYNDGDARYDTSSDINLLRPKEIKEFLDDYVIGQEEAKKFCPLRSITIINVSFHRKVWMWSFRKAIY